MNFESIKPFLLPLFFIGYFVFKWRRFAKVKAKIPALLESGAVVIDVRSSNEFSAASNPCSQNVPLDQFENELKKFDKHKTYILCCASGARSGMAMSILKKNGFTAVVNAGPWQNTI